MKQIIAYKAFNGRLFESEDKCIEYEKLMSEYPKETTTTIKNGHCDITHVLKYLKKTHYSQNKKTEDYYIVAGKYKFSGCYEEDMMCNIFEPHFLPTYDNVYNIGKQFALLALSGIELNKKTINYTLSKYKEANKYSKLTITEMSNDETMFNITDVRWHSGSIKPFYLKIEKL